MPRPQRTAILADTARFADALISEAAAGRKRDRTRATIATAACRLLDGCPLATLTIAEICKAAGIAHGTFYIYFADRNALLGDLLLEFVEFIQVTMRAAAHQPHGDPIRATTAAYYDLFEANPGLMKCLVNHVEDLPEATRAFQKLNHDWATTVMASLRRQGGMAAIADDELTRRVYAMGGMVDQYLTALLLNGDTALARVSGDREAVIDTLTTLWKKGLAE